MERSIFLVRHGIPDFPDGKIIIQGRNTDLALNPLCFSDASNLKQFFADKQIENWYSSPLKRAQQTLMQFIPHDAEPVILNDSAEVCYGRWEGKSWEDCKAIDPELFALRGFDNTILPPDGEDMRKAAHRMFNAVKSTEGNCVITSHWTVISLLYCLIAGFPYEKYAKIPHPYLGVSKIIESNGLYRFEYVGNRVCETPYCDTIHNY